MRYRALSAGAGGSPAAIRFPDSLDETRDAGA
jgi:hypothetical protein